MSRLHQEGTWEAWPLVCLRGAGFPIGLLGVLAMPHSAAASQQLVLVQEELGDAIEICLSELARAIEPLQGKARRPFAKAIKQLRRGTVPQSASRLGEASLESVRTKAANVEKQEQVLAKAFASDMVAVQSELEALASNAQFREAIAWQNLNGLRTGVDKIHGGGVKYQRFMANYLQRYCAKNDTIGFFGPVGWGAITNSQRSIVEPGDSLLAHRTVYFEHWAIETLANVYMQDQELLPYLRPRQVPTRYVEGDVCYHSLDQADPLPVAAARAVVACDGNKTALQIINELSELRLIEDPDDGYELLDSLTEQKLIYWSIEIPTSGFRPELELETQLAAAPKEISAAHLASLARLVQAKKHVEEAAGSEPALCAALDALNSCFADITGTAATRAGGQVYAGRTLVFEDCLRDAQLELGQDFLCKLETPLALVLASARWYSWEVAQRYKTALYQLYEKLSDADGTPVSYLAFQAAFKGLFPGPDSGGGIVANVRETLQKKWNRIIGDSDSAIQLDATSISEQVLESFAAPAPGWPSARHQSPDMMIAASGVESFRNGNYQIVLGELHVGLATPSIPLFSKEHPQPSVLADLRSRDLPEPGIAPTWNNALRANLFSTSPHDFDLETGTGRSCRPRTNVLSAAECVVEKIDGELYVRSRRNQQSFHLLAFIEQHLIAESYSEFQILGHTKDHTPRISIDAVVVSREQWRVNRSELHMIDSKLDRSLMFHHVRLWAKEKGMPRYCFVKCSTETKPFYLDFDSTLTIENFARHVRKADSITISEMLPSPDQSWLPDAAGNVYCSELRLCMTDPLPWQHSADS